MISAVFHETAQRLSPSVSVEATWGSAEDISSQEKITRLAAELGRELDRSGDAEIRKQVLKMISNNSDTRRGRPTSELSSRGGHLNASFISDEGNASGSDTSSVLQTDATIEIIDARPRRELYYGSQEDSKGGQEDSRESSGTVFQTEAIIENCNLPEITEEIAIEEDGSAIVEEADNFLNLHPQHQDPEEDAYIEQGRDEDEELQVNPDS